MAGEGTKRRTKGQHWIPTVVIVGITSGLVASDPNTAPSFRTTNSFSGYNRVLSETNTGAFIAAVPASIYAVGLIKKDSYAQSTALLAAEAFADGFALDLAFKGITGRKQPLQYTGNGPYADSFFNGTWSAVRTPVAAQLNAVLALVLSGMNDVLNSQGYTQAAWWNRTPVGAWGLMATVAICSCLLITAARGHGSGVPDFARNVTGHNYGQRNGSGQPGRGQQHGSGAQAEPPRRNHRFR